MLLWQVSQAAVVATWLAGLPGRRRAVVAGGAAGGDAGVSERGAGERDGALVAGLAGRRRHDVVAGLPVAVVPLWQEAQPEVMPVW